MSTKQRLRPLILLLALLITMGTLSKTLQSDSQHFIKTLKHQQHAHIGLVLEDTQTKRILYQHNSKQYFIPASLLKLFTAAAAALYLKPNFTYNTKLYYNGKIQNHTLYGNLFIRFSGDPTLQLSDVDAMLMRLSKYNIRRIQGHVFLDDSIFNHVPYPPGIIWDNLSYSFASPVTAMIFNENKFLLHFIPRKNQSRPILQADLPRLAASFTNHLRTLNHSKQHCPITIYSNSNNHYTIGGCLNRKLGKQRRSLAIRNMRYVASLEIAQLVQDLNIPFTPPILYKKTPPSATLIAIHTSKPLTKIIHTMLKESDNLISNALLKTIGSRFYQQPGNWQNGLRALAKILTPITGINFKKLRMTDGAGLSRYNLVQPHQILALLNAIRHNPTLKQVILPALPIAGIDGTLEWRLTSFKKNRILRAKTGTMSGISNLAGFIHSRKHGNITFVLMTNGFVDKPRHIEAVADKLFRNIALR